MTPTHAPQLLTAKKSMRVVTHSRADAEMALRQFAQDYQHSATFQHGSKVYVDLWTA